MDKKLTIAESTSDEEHLAVGGVHAAGRADDLAVRMRAAAAVAKAHAPAVDAEGRFPKEAFAEIRRQRLLGILVAPSQGGEGAGLSAVADVCYTLGQACSSSALIYAMHQVKVACVSRHARERPRIEGTLRRIVGEQLLLASSTTEGKMGGNVRSSEAAVVVNGDGITLERKAAVISYAREADGIVTTARRSESAVPSDQVLVVLLKADYDLTPLSGWDALGMRGTQSEGFTLRARASVEQILPDPYDKIHAHTMVPVAHLLWGSVWAGIAAAAVGRAQAFVRLAARQSGGQLPPGAHLVIEAQSSFATLRGLLASALRRYEAAQTDERMLTSLEFQSTMTLLKVQASDLAVSIVLTCLRSCGLAGYRNDTEFNLGRLLRDVLSAPLMINNERILSNLATAALMQPLPPSIAG